MTPVRWRSPEADPAAGGGDILNYRLAPASVLHTGRRDGPGASQAGRQRQRWSRPVSGSVSSDAAQFQPQASSDSQTGLLRS